MSEQLPFCFCLLMLESVKQSIKKYDEVYSYRSCIWYFVFSTVVVWNISEFRQSIPIFHTYTNWYDLIDSVTDVEVYGQVLYIFCAAIFWLD
jgi:hypothetical protein